MFFSFVSVFVNPLIVFICFLGPTMLVTTGDEQTAGNGTTREEWWPETVGNGMTQEERWPDRVPPPTVALVN